MGKLSTQLTDEVFRAAIALAFARSSAKADAFCMPPHPPDGVYTPLLFVAAVPSRVKSRVAISSPEGEGFFHAFSLRRRCHDEGVTDEVDTLKASALRIGRTHRVRFPEHLISHLSVTASPQGGSLFFRKVFVCLF